MTLVDLFRYVDGTLDGDPWPLVRELAAGGDRAAAESVQAALERYVRERNWYGRDLTAHVLAGLSGAEVFSLLLRVFADALRGTDDDDSEQLGQALSAVRGLGLLGVSLDARQSRTEDPDWWVRAAVADVLAANLRRWPRARSLLAQMAGDANPTVRETATKALHASVEETVLETKSAQRGRLAQQH